jgi:two-component system response regulator PilR (NtrC family)
MSGGDVIERDDLGLDDGGATEPPLPDEPAPQASVVAPTDPPALLPSDLQAYLDDVERDILVRALERYRYNRTAAGASMGLSLRQMRYRMARLGVTAGDSFADPV